MATDPRAALREADEVVAEGGARVPVDLAAAVATAHRAAGLALRELGEAAAAERRLRRAVALAERAGDPGSAGRARMSLAYVLLERGRVRAALIAADAAAPALTGVEAARLEVQRASVLARSGRADPALAAYAAALPVLQRAGDDGWEAHARNNRGLLLAYRGDTAAAEADLTRARALGLRTGRSAFAAYVLCNLAWVAGMVGDVPRALALYDDAEPECADLDVPERHVDRAEVLLRAGLPAEARDVVERALAGLDADSSGALVAEASLLLAQCALDAGDPAVAGEAADRAARLFAAQDRPSWQRLAEYVRLRCRPDAGGPAGLATADRLDDAGWAVHAADLRLAVAAAALDAGDRATARRAVTGLAASRPTRAALVRRAHHARALMAVAAEDPRRADRELRRAWSLAEADRELRGAAELRAVVAGQTDALVERGLELAVRTGSAAAAVAWAERGRAAHLRHPRVRPPRDPELAAALDSLRAAVREDEQARLAGEPDPAAAARRHRAERRVVDLARTSPGAGRRGEVVSAAVLRSCVDDRTVVAQYLVAGSRAWAVVSDERRSRLVPLGPPDPIRTAARTLAFALGRVTTGFGSARGRAAAATALVTAASALDAALVAPIAAAVGERDLVVSPTGTLVEVPWGLLPSCRSRSVSVAPSLTAWCRSRRDPPRPPATTAALVVAGPDLSAGEAEVHDVAARHPGALTLTGARATVADVLAAMPSADLAHIAAHGRLRADNPQLSSLQLADGPLTGYDLERLPATPRTVLLPACHGGRGRAPAGDETLGLAWSLLAGGATAVVAPLVAVPDEATAALMTGVHDGLAAGLTAPAALARARVEVDQDDPLARATAGAFVSFGG